MARLPSRTPTGKGFSEKAKAGIKPDRTARGSGAQPPRQTASGRTADLPARPSSLPERLSSTLRDRMVRSLRTQHPTEANRPCQRNLQPVPRPPIAPRKPATRTLHGRRRTDDYAWLKDENWQQVMRNPVLLRTDIRAHLEAENACTEASMAPAEALRAPLPADRCTRPRHPGMRQSDRERSGVRVHCRVQPLRQRRGEGVPAHHRHCGPHRPPRHLVGAREVGGEAARDEDR